MSSRRKPLASSQVTTDQTSLTWNHYSTEPARLSRTPTIIIRILSYQHEALSRATQYSDTKTFWSSLLLRYFQLDSMIPVIHGSIYAARSSPRSKYCNTHISMQAIIDSDGYLCRVIPIIKRRDLGGYKEIIRVNHTIMWIQNIRTHEDNSDGYKYFSLSIKKGVSF